jgi:glycosyltransferase involved in cell wall biosynthesis
MPDGVLLVCNTLSVGGAERHWASLAPALAARGVPVSIETLGPAGPLAAEVRAAGIAVCPGVMASNYDLRGFVSSLSTPGVRPATVMTSGTMPGLVGQIIARRIGARHIVNYHRQPAIDLNRQERVLDRIVLQACDGVLAVAESQRSWLLGRGVPDRRITVIPNGIEPAALVPTETRLNIRSSLGLVPSDVLVLMLAALRPEKRADLFAAAVSSAKQRNPQVAGRIAGPGEVALPDSSTVLLGPRSDVANLLYAADMLVAPSDHEALPLAVLEAMVAGLPVLATTVGDLPALIEHDVSGLLVPPGRVEPLTDAIVRLAGDPGLRARLADAARRRALAAYGWEAMVSGYVRALASPGSGREAGGGWSQAAARGFTERRSRLRIRRS